MYPNTTVMTITDPRFNPISFQGSGEEYMIREIEGFGNIKQLIYLPPLQRRDGVGNVVETVSVGGYTIAWKDVEFTAIIATVRHNIDELMYSGWKDICLKRNGI
jgi:hypothetical protein